MADIDATLKERGNRYGAFKGHARVTQRLKRVVADELAQRGKSLADDQQEALDMIFHKIGRVINGDENYDDSWLDMSGYPKLVADRLQTETRDQSWADAAVGHASDCAAHNGPALPVGVCDCK